MKYLSPPSAQFVLNFLVKVSMLTLTLFSMISICRNNVLNAVELPTFENGVGLYYETISGVQKLYWMKALDDDMRMMGCGGNVNKDVAANAMSEIITIEPNARFLAHGVKIDSLLPHYSTAFCIVRKQPVTDECWKMDGHYPLDFIPLDGDGTYEIKVPPIDSLEQDSMSYLFFILNPIEKTCKRGFVFRYRG